MKKTLLSLLGLIFLSSCAVASGPLNRFSDPKLDQEFENVYNDLKYPNSVYAKISTASVTLLNLAPRLINDSDDFADISVIMKGSFDFRVSTDVGPPYGVDRAGLNFRTTNDKWAAGTGYLNRGIVIRSPGYLYEHVNPDGSFKFQLGMATNQNSWFGQPSAITPINYEPQNKLEVIGSLLVGADIAGLSTAPANGAIIQGGIAGTKTNDVAAAGVIGEYVESVITSAVNFPTSGTFGDLTSISLTAGDWDVSIVGRAFANGATVTDYLVGIAQTSGGTFTNEVDGSNTVEITPTGASLGLQFWSPALPTYRVSLSATTTIYYKYTATYTVATPKLVGRISARRVR